MRSLSPFFTKFIVRSAVIVGLGFSGLASADGYAVVNVGSGNVDTEIDSESDFSYSAALGYQFHRQWYVEGGYISFIDTDNSEQSISSKGPYLALLGKAGSQKGELYYKLGVASVDIEHVSTASAACGSDATVCGQDETVIAGLAGIGFDYYLGLQSMVRLEYTYFGGKDDFSANVINLGFRYNF
ncbi:outer membrane protein [Alteromonas sp. S015]|uniref:outer membrane protein n=1 Tax=Alteromonas sp. S015 TaxID=3117401 RepID=UPI002FE3D6FB